MSRGEAVVYRRFDCSAMTLTEPIRVEAGRVTVIEGAYSMHEKLGRYYDLSVFLDIDPELQKKRIKKRNGSGAKAFFERWIPLENAYFSQTGITARCDILISISEN